MSELYRRLNVHRLMQRAYLSQPIASAGDSSVEHLEIVEALEAGDVAACARGRACQRRDGKAARARGDRARGRRPVTPPLVRMTGISKAFHGRPRPRRRRLRAAAGEIHALAGENGSGKSTLVKILYGGLQADAGRIEIDGGRSRSRARAQRSSAGIVAISQELTLAPTLTVAENVLMGRLPRRSGMIDWRRARRARRRGARRARRPRRPASARRRALDRAPAGGRGGARGLRRLARARARRGDELALGGGDRPPARTARAPARAAASRSSSSRTGCASCTAAPRG